MYIIYMDIYNIHILFFIITYVLLYTHAFLRQEFKIPF